MAENRKENEEKKRTESDATATTEKEVNKEPAVDPKDVSKNPEFQQCLKELKTLASKDGPTTGYEIVQRLVSDTFLNPFDVLMLGPESSEEEIKKQHRMV